MRTNAKQRDARTALLFSGEQLAALKSAHVMIFGLGGVGGYAAEALGRMGIGKLMIVDKDRFELSNINRQICALTSTVGKPKAEVTRQRLLDINPDAEVIAIEKFHLPKTPVPIPGDVDIVIDAVDTVAAKLYIIETCFQRNIRVISCMGMGNRLDPSRIQLGDIYDTSNCALSRVIRKELRKRGIPSLRCVYSTEEAARSDGDLQIKKKSRPAPGSVAYVPSIAGLLMAYDAVHMLINKTDSGDRC
ncbi:MAG: tRNA threonylcarbamoyladenosine dehydratase [Clostridiales bacterium]|nr:tRNA threonylcarbamoyladenosine dehydratase [Clostridiales bacterium]